MNAFSRFHDRWQIARVPEIVALGAEKVIDRCDHQGSVLGQAWEPLILQIQHRGMNPIELGLHRKALKNGTECNLFTFTGVPAGSWSARRLTLRPRLTQNPGSVDSVGDGSLTQGRAVAAPRALPVGVAYAPGRTACDQ
jgi:hypothetical protein